MARIFWGFLACTLVGCASWLGIEDLPPLPDAGTSDGGVDAAAPIDAGGSSDAGGCAEAVDLKLAIDGQAAALAPGAPVKVDVLVGDVVELSAASSCATAGTLTYAWQITPDEGKAAPAGLDGEALSFYPTQADIYLADVTIHDGMGNEAAAQVQITAHGWQAIEVATGNDDVTDVRDLDVSDDDLWIASINGGYRLPLVGVQDAFISTNSELTSNFIGGKLTAVYYARADNRIWFGNNDNLPAVWRVDLGQPPVSLTAAFSTVDALNTSANVHAIGSDGASGVMVATDQGLTEAADNQTFTGDVEPQGDIVDATAVGGGRRWGGAQLLYDLDDVTAPAIDPFDSGIDDKIRALVVDEANGELWVGSESKGIARVNNDTGDVLAAYTTADGLPSNDIRHIRVETSGAHAGDVWVATDAGVARYVRARDEWVAMGNTHGLINFLDVKAIAIDEANGRRVIYAGTRDGVVYIRTP